MERRNDTQIVWRNLVGFFYCSALIFTTSLFHKQITLRPGNTKNLQLQFLKMFLDVCVRRREVKGKARYTHKRRVWLNNVNNSFFQINNILVAVPPSVSPALVNSWYQSAHLQRPISKGFTQVGQALSKHRLPLSQGFNGYETSVYFATCSPRWAVWQNATGLHEPSCREAGWEDRGWVSFQKNMIYLPIFYPWINTHTGTVLFSVPIK